MVVDDELTFVDRPSELPDEREPVGRVVVVLRVVELRVMRLLAQVHRHVRVPDERLDVVTVLGRDGDPDRSLDLQRQSADDERTLHGTLNSRGELERGVRVGRSGCEDAELVAAEPGDRVRVAHRRAESLREEAKDLVTALVTEGVVDLLEVVEVEDHHDQPVFARALLLEGVGDPIAKEVAVRQAREAVVQGLVLDLGDVVPEPVGHSAKQREQQGVEREQEELEHSRDRQEPLARVTGDRGVVLVELEGSVRNTVVDAHRDEDAEDLGLISRDVDGGDSLGLTARECLADFARIGGGAPDQPRVARVRHAPVRPVERDAESATDQDLASEDSIELGAPCARDGPCEVGGQQAVRENRLCDEVRMEGCRLFGLADRVLADEEQDPGGRDRKPDGGVDREAENEPGWSWWSGVLGGDVRQRGDIGLAGRRPEAQRRVRQVLPQVYQ